MFPAHLSFRWCLFQAEWIGKGTLVQVYERLALVVAMENENAES
jgi:hypothetical protein